MQSLALPTLTPAVGASLLASHLASQPLPTPAEFAAPQRYLTAPLSLVLGGARLPFRLGSPALTELARDPPTLLAVRESCAGSSHLLNLSAGGEVLVLLLEGAAPRDVLLAILHAGLVQQRQAQQRQAALASPAASPSGPPVGHHLVRALLAEARRRLPAFADELERAGWDLDSASRLEELPSRVSFPGSGASQASTPPLL